MVQPSSLKRKHSVKGLNLFPLVRRIRDCKTAVKAYARIIATQPIEDLSVDELKSGFKDITGEDASEVLKMADKDVTVHSLRLAVHFAVLYANEAGAPKGQPLTESLDSEVTNYFTHTLYLLHCVLGVSFQ